MILQEMIRRAQLQLTQAGVDNPILDTRLLFAHALGCDRAALTANPERLLSDDEIATLSALITRRANREPVGRILGTREFWGLPFCLNEATLEPRPDSETLIEAALNCTKMTGAPHSILDLGTGTGCLLLALLHEWPHATGLGIDQSECACRQAEENAQRLGLEDRASFLQSDWFSNVTNRFDMIVSNPPYIPDADIDFLQPEVKVFDPLAALDGGADGLDPYRIIIPMLKNFLPPSGHVLFEVGAGQAGDVAHLMEISGFKNIQTHKDLGGIDRVVSCQNL